jgi:hypothetical protein
MKPIIIRVDYPDKSNSLLLRKKETIIVTHTDSYYVYVIGGVTNERAIGLSYMHIAVSSTVEGHLSLRYIATVDIEGALEV